MKLKYDECEHCSVRGDIDTCLNTPCELRNNWCVQTLMQKINLMEANNEQTD